MSLFNETQPGLKLGEKILPSEILGGFGTGNVYYVIPSTKAFYNDFISNFQTQYSDGSMAVYTDTGDGAAIQAAITASKGGRNDYIIVLPGSYQLTAALDMAGRSSLHLISANIQDLDEGGMGAALLQQTGNYECLKMEAYGEVTGFQFINKVGYPAITMATNKWRANVHHNYFHTVGGTACNIIEAAGTGFSHGNISNNRFQTWVGGNFTSYINIAGSNTVVVEKNLIIQYNGTVDCAIQCGSGVQNVILDNTITDCGGAGVITIGVDVGNPTGNTAIGNRIATLSGRGLAGGTASRSFVVNYDSTSGGTIIET